MEQNTSVPLCLPSNFVWDPLSKKIKVVSGRPRGDVLLCKDGRAVLEAVKDDYVVVICITGPARTGKSFLLSQIQDGVAFELGHSTTSKTTGIWIAVAPKPVRVNGVDARLVLLDAEGLGSTSTIDEDGCNERWDKKLFILCALFSSYLIYNSKGIPNSDDLDKLSFIAQFKTSLHGHSDSTSNEGSTKDVVDVAPYFMWLVRDALLQPEVAGARCSWKTFIESSVLSVDSGATSNRRNAIKKAIRTSFRFFNAYGLPPPSVDPDVVQNLTLPAYQDRINETFLSKLQELKEEVLFCSEVKVIKGRQITGQQLAMYVSSCVNAVNFECDKFPIQNAWDSFLELKWNEILTKTMEKYDKQASKITVPVSITDIEKFHKEEGDAVRKDFIQFLASNFDKESAESYREKLELALKENLLHLRDKCNKDNRSHFEHIAMKLEREQFENIAQNFEKHSFAELVNAKETVMAEYTRQGKGLKLQIHNDVMQELDKRITAKIKSLQPALILISTDDTWEMYETEVRNEIEAHLPLKAEALNMKKQRILKLCVRHFEQKCRGCDDYQRASSKLRAEFRKKLHSLDERNLSLSRVACEKVMRSCKRDHFDPVWKSLKEMRIYDVDSAKRTTLEEYERKACGPAKDSIKASYSEDMEDQLCQAKSVISENSFTEAEKNFKGQIDQLLQDGPLEAEDAAEKCEAIWKGVRKRFETRCHGLNDPLQQLYNKKLSELKTETVTFFNRRNEQLSTKVCEKLMTSLISKILKPSIDNMEILVNYEEKKELILEEYMNKAKGPSREKVRNDFVSQIDSDIKRGEQQRILKAAEIVLECAALAGMATAGASKTATVGATVTAATVKYLLSELKKHNSKK